MSYSYHYDLLSSFAKALERSEEQLKESIEKLIIHQTKSLIRLSLVHQETKFYQKLKLLMLILLLSAHAIQVFQRIY